MIVNLTQKETSLLKDLKSHEELCIKKYNNYSNITCCPELKALFKSHASNESSHLDSINQLLSGQLPNMNSGSSGGQSSGSQSQGQGSQGASSMGDMQSQNQTSQGSYPMGTVPGENSDPQGPASTGTVQSQGLGVQNSSSMGGMQGQSQTEQKQFTDKYLCTDVLSTEKYVSSTYNTAIFEFTDPQVRDVLNHIQKEEQQHGESVFKYMESKGLYQPQ